FPQERLPSSFAEPGCLLPGNGSSPKTLLAPSRLRASRLEPNTGEAIPSAETGLVWRRVILAGTPGPLPPVRATRDRRWKAVQPGAWRFAPLRLGPSSAGTQRGRVRRAGADAIARRTRIPRCAARWLRHVLQGVPAWISVPGPQEP